MSERPPKTVGAAELKQHCLQILDELPREGLIITKRGKPVARLLPVPRSTHDLFGLLKDKLHIHGDIVETLDLSARFSWTADAPNVGSAKSALTKRAKR